MPDITDAVGMLIKQIEGVYDAYLEKSQDEKNKKKGVARLFARWFSGFDASSAAPEHQAFLDDIARLTSELTQELSSSNDAVYRDINARAAVEAMLSRRESRETSSYDWYLLVAESECEKFIPFISPDHLRTLADEYLKKTPKHKMLPNQAKLYKSMLRTAETEK